MIILVAVSMSIATSDAGGLSGLLAITPTNEMTVAAAITLVFGTFVSGGKQCKKIVECSQARARTKKKGKENES